MEEIIVRVSDLEQLAALLKFHQMDFARLCIMQKDAAKSGMVLIVDAMTRKNPNVIYEVAVIPESSSPRCSFSDDLDQQSIT